MHSSNIGIAIDIIDYYPKDFDYSSFSFIFISEDNTFEREISFINANQICQKISIKNKKDIKYTIKVFKDDSLIGLTEFVIPNQIINKREKIFDKVCNINMTESTKKVLLGNLKKSSILKIGIHATLQYLEDNRTLNIDDTKNEKKQMFQKKKINNKKGRLKIFTPTGKTEKNIHSIANSSSAYNNQFNVSAHLKNNNSMIEHQNKKVDSFILEKNNKNKIHKRTFSSKNENSDEAKLKKIKKKILSQKERKNTNSEIIKDKNNITFDNKEEKKEGSELDTNKLKNEFDYYVNENNEKIDEINNVNDMINFTNNNIKKCLDYQLEYYTLIKEKINNLNKSVEQYKSIQEKIKQNNHLKNILIEKNKEYETHKEILLNKEKEIEIKNNEFSELKDIELNTMKEICTNLYQININNENDNDKNNQISLLLKVLRLISKKHGPLQNLLTMTNSIESQRTALKNILNKFKSELEVKEL